jgi:hypothetical protein
MWTLFTPSLLFGNPVHSPHLSVTEHIQQRLAFDAVDVCHCLMPCSLILRVAKRHNDNYLYFSLFVKSVQENKIIGRCINIDKYKSVRQP